MKKLLLAFSLVFVSLFANAQTISSQQKLYYTCKVWGFVKYYHSNVSTCHVNWDSVLVSVLPLVRNSTTDGEFNDALDTMLLAAGPMAIATTAFPDTLPANLKRNRDYGWISSPDFRSDVRTILDTIKNNFRPHTGCYVSNNIYPNPGGFLMFAHDSVGINVNTITSFPDTDHRLLMMFKQWNIVRYFNPYNYVLDTPWDTTLYNYVEPVASAPDALTLYYLYEKIATNLNDVHVFGLTWNANYLIQPGYYQPMVCLKYTHGQYVVIKSSLAGIHIGDAVVSVSGLTPTQWEDSLRPYYSSGNTAVFRRGVSQNMLARMSYGEMVGFQMLDSNGSTYTYNATTVNPYAYQSFFYGYHYPADSLDTIKHTTLPCNVGYVNIGNITDAETAGAYADLQDKSAIIFDLRNYPAEDAAWSFADLMYTNQWEFAKLTIPDVTYPGTYSWSHASLGNNGNPNPYTGRVIILVDEQTQSAAEYSAMILRRMPGAVVVGSQTAGADGNVTYWKLSQDMHFGYTSLGVFYPNGDSTQRIGIVPDSVIMPTRAGIRHHQDEVLEKALSIAGCNLGVTNINTTPATLTISPNPATETVNITLGNAGTKKMDISIADVTGKILLQQSVSNTGKPFEIAIHTLATGIYLVKVNADGLQYISKLVKQ